MSPSKFSCNCCISGLLLWQDKVNYQHMFRCTEPLWRGLEGKHVCCLYLWRQSPERLTTPPAQHTHGCKSSIWISIVYQWSKSIGFNKSCVPQYQYHIYEWRVRDINEGLRLGRQLVACCVKCLGKSVKLQRIHSRYPVNCHHQPLSSSSPRWNSSH